MNASNTDKDQSQERTEFINIIVEMQTVNVKS